MDVDSFGNGGKKGGMKGKKGKGDGKNVTRVRIQNPARKLFVGTIGRNDT